MIHLLRVQKLNLTAFSEKDKTTARIETRCTHVYGTSRTTQNLWSTLRHDKFGTLVLGVSP